MKMKDFAGKFKSLYLWGNLAAMAVVVIAAVMLLKYGLAAYTHHGESIEVPDVRHKICANAKAQLEMLRLKVVTSDTGYVKSLPPDCVLEQTPAPGTNVKSGHVIYLIVNALHSPLLTIPDLIDNSSLREATARLSAMGFKLGEPQLVAGEKDWVYGIIVDGRHVVTGQKISVEKTLVIEVGDGQLGEEDSITYIDPSYGEPQIMTEEDPFEEVSAPPAVGKGE